MKLAWVANLTGGRSLSLEAKNVVENSPARYKLSLLVLLDYSRLVCAPSFR